jgi:hypothetical protein
MQIRFLCEREKEFSEGIESLTRNPAFRLYCTLIWPARKHLGWIKSRPRG